MRWVAMIRWKSCTVPMPAIWLRWKKPCRTSSMGLVLTSAKSDGGLVIVPTLCVGMQPVTLCVTILKRDAERPVMHSHAERGNER
ncbi:hypothetical protein EMIT0194MI4_210003 [Pseudomonas sp. IT-194MI4]